MRKAILFICISLWLTCLYSEGNGLPFLNQEERIQVFCFCEMIKANDLINIDTIIASKPGWFFYDAGKFSLVSPLKTAVDNSNFNVALKLIDHGMLPFLKMQPEYYYQSLLNYALFSKNPGFVSELLKRKTKFNASYDDYNKSISDWGAIAYNNNADLVNQVVKLGLDVNNAILTKGSIGFDVKYPLHVALENKYYKTADALLSNGANINAISAEVELSVLDHSIVFIKYKSCLSYELDASIRSNLLAKGAMTAQAILLKNKSLGVKVVTIDSGVRLRKEPNLTSAVVRTLPTGSELTVEYCGDSWVYQDEGQNIWAQVIDDKGNDGWVCSRFVRIKDML